jgi:hypothetical protein
VSYRPYAPAQRPGKPDAKPPFRVLVHHQFLDIWSELEKTVGLESVQQFWDHVAFTPGSIPPINRSSILKGKAGRPQEPGFSKTIHYEISGAGRINYQWNPAYVGSKGDPHGVVWILTITLGSH